MLFFVKKPIGYSHGHVKDNNEIICDVKFGDGKYSSTVTLDTLSSDIWIPAEGCKEKCFPEKSE